ncbi:arabinosyltransferase B [Saccharopolyspora erythraea NRRL 2338]|uniref:Arabinosyl transferase n=2 Tax=Saccharopolyspora erythraea TaxID=1836 RepID=A4F664_SACEN|nr:arabinosyltransferase domain-containing protein [Saccharopolyspora erythraea]PFG93339.1 arabinosyltransferase B [Saccharopolyspora erythraea NRRL 2338]QRK90179.1 arabinosyltransferase domain-containing protein [Saccharopolyspora erythraea]CAL99538.1 arabinosyl transferase [Saccharopolyspora erythraea NRRL 2338]
MGAVPPSDDGQTRIRRRHWTLAGLACLTLVFGVLAVLSPVRADAPVVNWPKAGSAPTSTVLPLSPYRPLDIDATIPCQALNSVGADGGAALNTHPADGPGMNVTARSGTARFWVDGQEVLVDSLRTSCVYHVRADAGGVRIDRDGVLLLHRADLLPPQVSELSTQAADTGGLAVQLHPDARYESTPTALKTVLLIAHGLSLFALLVLAWRVWRGTGPGMRFPRFGAADAVVLLVSVAWIFLGPSNMDDGWYMMMARNAGENGYMGNFVYMFNVTENPFVLSQYLLQVWGELGGWSLWWMRVVPTVCGLVTWMFLRVLLATLLGRAATLRAVPWALLAAHLLWYLPYGTTLRPEPVIVMCAAATLVFAEAAVLRQSIGALAVATVCAALAVTASPSGVVAVAPLLLCLPWLVQWLRAQPWAARVAAVLLAAASATVVVPVGFADATLADVVEATRVHQWYYLSFSWYEEFQHYNTLLNTAGWARRLPVLLTLAVVVVVAIASGRGGMGRDPIRRLTLVSVITTSVALVLIALSPTKWVNHFHAVAAAPTVLLAAVLLRSPLPRRAGLVVTGASVLLLVGAVSLSFAGDNRWMPFTDAGQRFGEHLNLDSMTNNLEPHIGPLYLRNPLIWVGVAVAAWLWARWRRRHGQVVRVGPDRAVLGAASFGAVLLMLALFVVAPIGQAPGWTVARSGVQAMAGGCGLASDVRVQLPAGRLGPPGEAELSGDFATTAPPLPTSPWEEPTTIWHDERPDGSSTGTGRLATGWYPIAEPAPHVTVPVAGRLDGQVLEVEFATPAGVVTETLHPELRRSALREWQQLSVEVPAGASALRAVVVDQVTGARTWLAVAEPKLTDDRPVTELTRGRAVLANHINAPLWPCVDQVGIRDGITDTPVVRLTADEGLPPEWLDNISNLEWGGAWVGTTREWVQTRLHAELPGGPPRAPWGNVFVIRYLHPVGQYDLRVPTEIRSSLERFPTLADNDYPDIERNAGTQQSESDSEAR